MIDVAHDATGVSFAVRLQPRAGRREVRGEHNAALKVAVTAPPEAGKANQALIDLLAQVLRVPKTAIEVVAGHSSRNKRVHVVTGAPHEVLAKLQEAGGQNR